MTQYIDKSAIVAEIERRLETISNASSENNRELAAIQGAQQFELINIVQFLNTLEVKEVQEPTAADRGMAEEIIVNLKRVEQDYHIDLTREMEWVRNLMKKGEPVSRTPADIEAAMQEVEEKSRAFTEAHQGENTDTILAQMRGEELVSNDLEEAAFDYAESCKYDGGEKLLCVEHFKAGAKWQKGKTLSDVKKAVIGKAFQFSMENVEAWGDDSNGNGKTIKLKGHVTFQVSNPESIIDALFTELENDK